MDTIITKNVIIIQDSLININQTFLEVPKNSDSPLVTYIITIILALIAALIALYQVKMNIVTSSRIKWIENIRESIGHFCSEVSIASLALVNLRGEALRVKDDEMEKVMDQYYPQYLDASIKADRIGKIIKLHLNLEEEEHKNLDVLVSKIIDNMEEKKLADIDLNELDVDLNELVRISKIILKKEWDRSKKILSQ